MINEYEVLKNFSYVRTGGSKEELKAANYLKSVFEEIGLKAVIENFDVQAADVNECSLEVTKPYKKKIACLPYFCSASTDGLKKEIYILKNVSNKYELSNVKDKIVIINGYLRMWVYKDLIDNGAAGVIVADGFNYVDNKDIDQRELREPLQKFGLIPVVQINTKDLVEMIHSGVTEVKMINKQSTTKTKSRNVVAKIKGETDRSIVFTAHYDSTSLSSGAWDNGTGTVTVLKLAEHFVSHPSKYNLIFVLCGSEERGLLGSHAYVKKHKKELDKYDLCINIDMVGSVLANMLACVTGESACVNHLDYYSKIYGYSLHVYQDVYSSDSTPFADEGIPAISFGSHSNATPIHCRYDSMDIVDEKTLNKDIKFIIDYSDMIVNAALMPIKRIMPEEMKEKLDYYLGRKRKEN